MSDVLAFVLGLLTAAIMSIPGLLAFLERRRARADEAEVKQAKSQAADNFATAAEKYAGLNNELSRRVDSLEEKIKESELARVDYEKKMSDKITKLNFALRRAYTRIAELMDVIQKLMSQLNERGISPVAVPDEWTPDVITDSNNDDGHLPTSQT
jgi:predicted RNase H-like nuclease (RuvC/YqgF family)